MGERWMSFTQCPGCGLDLATGEGERGCALGECAYLPGELDVYCPQCRFNFFTEEGNPPCDDPLACEHGVEARGHVANLEAWRAARRSLAGAVRVEPVG